MYLFNPKRGGLDLSDEGQDKVDDLKVATLFGGTPRILPFVATALFETVSGFPGMIQLPGASLQYYLISRPDIKRKSLVWKENTFISPSDSIPGIAKINLRGIDMTSVEKLVISQVQSIS